MESWICGRNFSFQNIVALVLGLVSVMLYHNVKLFTPDLCRGLLLAPITAVVFFSVERPGYLCHLTGTELNACGPLDVPHVAL